jgi:hypothetical protein
MHGAADALVRRAYLSCIFVVRSYDDLRRQETDFHWLLWPLLPFPVLLSVTVSEGNGVAALACGSALGAVD